MMWVILKDGIKIYDFDDKPIFKEGVLYYPVHALDIKESDVVVEETDSLDNYVLPIQSTLYVPESITKWQAELILLDMGILPAVQMAISADPAMSIVYQGVTTFERSNGLITQVALAQNIPDDVIDKMFLAANRYTTEMATDQSVREEVMREVGLTQ